ncbi:MAG: hypothetical protein B7733_19695 [Myxococcales bacterium FL481]|nr:MAG: hypothetical protein B7733_19695 [Myxococcales bacterium FL481]
MLLNSSGNDVDFRFVYNGPTAQTKTLRSGALRRQLGVKLRALDSCNVLYAMWRLDASPRVVVSVKHNPNAHEHAACGTAGYRTLTPSAAAPKLAMPKVGEQHRMRAWLERGELTVEVDETVAWRGPVPNASLAPFGEAGIRTDNVDVTVVELAGSTGPSARRKRPVRCSQRSRAPSR